MSTAPPRGSLVLENTAIPLAESIAATARNDGQLAGWPTGWTMPWSR
jgi:hypothetical protein